MEHPEGGLRRDGKGPDPAIPRNFRSLAMPSYRHPSAEWKPSPNFWAGRLGHTMYEQPAYVVCHTMVCCEDAAWARFRQPAQQASSTYGVRLDGSLVQYVDEADAPWTNGTSAGIGSNLDSVTIEHEDCGAYNGERTPELIRTSALLVRGICQRYQIPIDRQHVLIHRECQGAATACPDSLDVDRIVRMAAGLEPLPGGEEEPMTPAERENMAAAFVRLVYIACRRGEPESQQVLDDWAARVAGDFDSGVAVMVDQSPEFQAALDLDRRLRGDYRDGKLGGSTEDDRIARVALTAIRDACQPK